MFLRLRARGFEWRTISLGFKNLAARVAAFRSRRDVDELTKSVSVGKAQLFDLAAAHELYVALFGPVEALIKDKAQLLIVASGPLTALPFHPLVTDKPAIAVPHQINEMAAYRDASWLVKRHAVTVLPSVASLKALRVFARKGQGTKPMIGFDDPVFAPDQAAAQAGQPSAMVKIAARTRAYSDYWRGASVNRARLADALSPLPDSAEKLKAVAGELGASPNDIYLGRNAIETNVKRLPLADYRVVYFATHGLVAGDVEGLGEPSLALTLPNEPSELDDGLLTASEVAQLKLNADWVVLSACNTTAGEKPGDGSPVGLRASLLLCRSPRAVGLTLANRFQSSDPFGHVDIRHHEIQPDHRPRGGAAPCNARLSRRQVGYLECLSGLLGLVLTRWGRCGTLKRVAGAQSPPV
jgi:CHAT domain-containing protein